MDPREATAYRREGNVRADDGPRIKAGFHIPAIKLYSEFPFLGELQWTRTEDSPVQPSRDAPTSIRGLESWPTEASYARDRDFLLF